MLNPNQPSQSFSPASFRAASKKLNEQLGDRWVVRDYDVQVEFYFRDASILPAVAADPDFHKLQVSVITPSSAFVA